MKILAFESSCDETAVAVVEDGRKVLTDQIFSQADLHAIYGGVVPEIASRSHVEVISQLAGHALKAAGIERKDIDAVAATYAPGLIGTLLVGLNFAKAVALSLDVPLIPVHHIKGHVAANYIAYPELEPPFLCLAISGGNTLIIDVRSYTDLKIMGATRDDAAGECFDKAARAMGMPYPGGIALDARAENGAPAAYRFPRPRVDGSPYDFSFSGMKTAVLNLLHNAEQKGESVNVDDVCASFRAKVVELLCDKTLAAEERAEKIIRRPYLAHKLKRCITEFCIAAVYFYRRTVYELNVNAEMRQYRKQHIRVAYLRYILNAADTVHHEGCGYYRDCGILCTAYLYLTVQRSATVNYIFIAFQKEELRCSLF